MSGAPRPEPTLDLPEQAVSAEQLAETRDVGPETVIGAVAPWRMAEASQHSQEATADPRAVARLRVAALVFPIGWLAGAALQGAGYLLGIRDIVDVIGIPLSTEALLVSALGFALWSVLCSGGLLLALRRGADRERAGLLFALITTVSMNLYMGHFPLTEASLVRAPLCSLWMLLIPSLVGAAPRRTLGVMALGALALPLGWLLWAPFGVPIPGPVNVAYELSYLGILLFAGVAPTVRLTRLQRELAAARREARELGSYQLVRRLGAGAMGEVWLARHRFLARSAAIKLIKAERLGEPSGRAARLERFRREAQATANLQSPHTVAVYDYGVDPDGQLYYAMELLDGVDLDQLVRTEGPLRPRRVVHFLQQACASLGEAHRYGLLHRDVKPSNMLACRYAFQEDFLKVVDFGLVKHVREAGPVQDPEGVPPPPGQSAADLPQLTLAHGVLGTPSFISPEAIRGLPLDARSDLYSLGCTAWFLLTGAPPFPRDSISSVLMAQVSAPPEEATLAQGGVPEPLRQILLRCLCKNPERRPQSAEELAGELAALAL